MARLDVQIDRLHQMKSILDDFQEFLVRQICDVESKLDELESMSFPEEVADKYRHNYLEEDKSIVTSLAAEIRSDHFSYIDNKIRVFVDTGDIN